MANGKVITGYSKPYVALYNNNNGAISYTDGMILARGVDVNDDPEVADPNDFYADNVLAETSGSTFAGSTLTMTVDGLKQEARKLISGIPAPEDVKIGEKTYKVEKYNKNQTIPYVGVGFVVRFMSGGVTSYDAFVMRKCIFNDETLEAATQEENIEFQPQELEARVMRDDSDDADWKYRVEDLATEAEAETIIKHFLGMEI